ncbi:hypothetical protein BDR06DRAFT_1008986 [Suillus hirtellus]|nr:hypothetical protein BDR06DRAFT_1008986 [Suillus hirtellus]
MSLQFRVGHIYSPPTVGKDATIFDWFSCSQHIVETLEGAFLKVAHVLPLQVNLPTMDTEDAYKSVYMDTCQQADLTPFTIPYSWKQLWVYMDNDLITRPVIQKDIEPGCNIILTDHCAPLSGSQFSDTLSRVDTGFDEAFLDDDFLSAIGSFKPDGEWTGAETLAFGIGFQMSATGDYILPSTSAAANMELHPPVPVTVSTGSKCNTTPPELTTFLPILITGIALANGPLPKSHYVICDPALFARGIKYTNETLKITFPAAAACICDATILARQHLTTHSIQETSFHIAFKDFIIEMMTVAKHAGQPVEQGFKCWDTNKVKPLDMVCKKMVDLVYYERYRFMKFLKENCSTFAEDLRKKALGGFCLEDYHARTVGPYITQLTGLTLWNDKVTSINFACSSNGV